LADIPTDLQREAEAEGQQQSSSQTLCPGADCHGRLWVGDEMNGSLSRSSN
jgi:hypothetical protein